MENILKVNYKAFFIKLSSSPMKYLSILHAECKAERKAKCKAQKWMLD